MSKNKNILQNGTTRYAFRKLEKDQNDGFEYLVTPSYIDKKVRVMILIGHLITLWMQWNF